MAQIVTAQNVQVDSQTYTPQQLVEDILIDSGCFPNVTFTNVSGGNFNGSDQSYGYFNANGSSFPFQEGVVLSTGRLQNVQGPNTSLSDDNAPNWGGDTDLETMLQENNTLNATILEFDFSTIADQINFRYLFASEEYQQGNPNTCEYSDLFAFLIKPAGTDQYTNIALIPDTQTPVKVTTVHPGIPGGCEAQNAAYFGSWNNSSAPINFNGQTAVLTATANIIPNETYHVKLVIADEQNYRYDSAVFLEGGSFRVGKYLGENRSLANGNALCNSETLTLDATMQGATSYQWFQDNTPLIGATSATYTVTQDGNYSVEIELQSNCTAFGEINIEYGNSPTVFNAQLTTCDLNTDGLAAFNLHDSEQTITNNDYTLNIVDYFLTEANALANIDPIQHPEAFENSVPNQTVFALVQASYGCYNVAEVQLNATYNPFPIAPYTACEDSPTETVIDLNAVTASFENQLPPNTQVTYYETESDAVNNTNGFSTTYTTSASNLELYVKITDPSGCYALSSITIHLMPSPELAPDETVYYCSNSYPETIRLEGGVINDIPNNYYHEWYYNGTLTTNTTTFYNVNETGTYTVVVTSTSGCSSSRTITVSPSDIAVIEQVSISGNSATVLVNGSGAYEYALNEAGPYQTSPTFSNLPAGFYTAYVRDQNGCGISEVSFGILGFPKFFTPNGDNVNDTWRPKGLTEDVVMTLYVFDRYGKLLVQFDPHSSGWNGTFKGQALPNDDYWYAATLLDGTKYQGHFALVR